MEMIKCSDALTISPEIEKHLKFNSSLFYKITLIQCDNNGCNQKLSLSNWYNILSLIVTIVLLIAQQ